MLFLIFVAGNCNDLFVPYNLRLTLNSMNNKLKYPYDILDILSIV